MLRVQRGVEMTEVEVHMSDVQVCHQWHSSAFDLLLIFLCSLIQALTLTPSSNNALLANMDMRVHMATHSRWQVAHTTGSTNSITTVVEVASGKGHA